MKYQFPHDLLEHIQDSVKETYLKTGKKGFSHRIFSEKDYRFFAKGVEMLNVSFTSDRDTLPKNYFNKKELRSGYLLYFLPVNALKISILMKDLPPDFFSKPRSVLDLGSGPGTGALGCLLAAPDGWSGHFTLVDQNRDILNDAQALFKKLGHGEPRCIVTDLHKPLKRDFPHAPFDLIIAANVFNEWKNTERKARFIESLIKKQLAPGGRMLIVEPALRHPTRDLMELRNRLLGIVGVGGAGGRASMGAQASKPSTHGIPAGDRTHRASANRSGINVYAPCLHQEACPMLAENKRDWCHMYWDWERPEMIEKFDRLVGIEKTYLKASYLLLGNAVGADLKPAPTKDQWRVVSGALNSKGKSERLLCGKQALPKLLRVTRLDKDKSTHNQDFNNAMRGDLVATGVRAKLGKNDVFKIL
jgi:SAM-dependent methyltransferase